MDLHPILLHSTRGKDKLGLLSLTKYNLSLVMGFLDEQVGWQANSSFLPVPSATLEVHTPFIFWEVFFCLLGVFFVLVLWGFFLSWDFGLWDLMFSSLFSRCFLSFFLFSSN